MANTLPTPVDILSQASLEGFSSVFAPITAFSTNFSDDTKGFADGVQVNLYGAAGAAGGFNGDYTANSDSTVQSVTVNLDQHIVKTVHVTDTQKANNGVELYKLGFWAGQSVAKYIATGVMGLITTGAYGLPVQTLAGAGNFDKSGILAGRTAGAGWGKDKVMIADSAYYSSALGNLPAGSLIQDETVREGSLGRVYGFETFETDLSPMVASNSSTKVIFAHPSAVAVAIRPLQPDAGSAYKDVRIVEDDKTKLKLTTRNWYSPDKGTEYFTVECNAGWARGVTGAAKVIYGG